MPTTGGDRLKAALRAGGKGGVRAVKVGFFATTKYSDGTPVTNVAAIQEFGTGKIPPRPFMRPASKRNRRDLVRLLAQTIDPKQGVVTPAIASEFGIAAEDGIRKAIADANTPPNAPATIRRKQNADPLTDSGKLKGSVSHMVEP